MDEHLVKPVDPQRLLETIAGDLADAKTAQRDCHPVG